MLDLVRFARPLTLGDYDLYGSREMSSNFDINTSEKAACLAEAHRWLNKAVALEADGKSASMVNMAFKKALDAENAAFDGRD